MIKIRSIFSFFGMLFLSMSIILLVSCSNAVEQMNHHFKNGEYLKAAESAIDGMKDQKLRPKVVEFLQKHGDRTIEKIFFKGDRLLDRGDYSEAISFYENVSKVLEQMILLDMPVSDLEQHLTTADQKYTEAAEAYSDDEYEKGKVLFDEKRYRAAIKTLRNAQLYFPSFKDSESLISKAETLAKRIVFVSPLVLPQSVTNRILNDQLATAVINKDTYIDPDLIPLIVEGIELKNSTSTLLISELNKHKSSFLTISETNASKNYHYLIDGSITADVEDNTDVTYPGILSKQQLISDTMTYKRASGNATSDWITHPFRYFRVDHSYKIMITLEAVIRLSHSPQVIPILLEREFTVSKPIRTDVFDLPADAVESRFPKSYTSLGDRDDVIDKAALVRDAQKEIVEELRKKILSVIDSDLDPYSKGK